MTPVFSKRQNELWLLGSCILLGIAFRIWGFFELGLIHFDEGVYAISGKYMVYALNEMQLYPKQALFSPPLFF